MATLLDALISTPEEEASANKLFRYAPPDWTLSVAREAARQEGLALLEDHLEVICALHEYFARNADQSTINMLELRDALEEKFHFKGGLKYLYFILPGGPVAQGCRLAGLKAPGSAQDLSYGNVR